jgi:uncharacterized protein (DUF342 family)
MNKREQLLDTFSIFISDDNLKGYLLIPGKYKDAYPLADILKKYLKDQGIVFGLKSDTLEQMVKEKICDSKICIAEGKPPEKSIAGKLEILIDISRIGKPKEFEDGSVDHKDLKKIINVKKGDKLVKKIPARPGLPGISIFGKRIDVGIPKEAELNPGTGTEISKDDENTLLSSLDGAVFFNKDGFIEVRNAEIITGDIDYSTGNFTFAGDLRVLGTVRAGFSVFTDGNLYIQGNVEDAKITSSGNIEIKGGAVGTKSSKISCKGNLKIHHVEHFSINTGKSIIIKGNVVHSNIKTDEFFKASKIVGGIIESSHGVEAEEIGSVSEIKTTIQIGGNFLLIQQQKAYQEKFSEFQKTLIELKDNIFSIVRYGMDEKGHLTHEELSKFEELKKEIRKIKVQTNILERKLAGIANKINMSPNPLLNANTIYPNTIIRFGLVEKVVKKILQSVCIQSIDNKIIIKKK